MLRTVVTASLLLLVYLDTAVLADDPCTMKPWPHFVSSDEVLKCWQTVPFSASARTATLKTLTGTLPLFAFLDVAQLPPTARLDFPPVNLLDALSKLSTASYTYEYEFHLALAALFRDLKDAHTVYTMPYCFGSFKFELPFSLLLYTRADGTQVVKGSPFTFFLEGMEAYYKQRYSIDPAQFVNATFVSINGLPAVEYLTRFAADSIGVSKDLGTRLNLAVRAAFPNPSVPVQTRSAMGDLFVVRDGTYAAYPPFNEPSVTVVIQADGGMPQTVIVPYVAYARSSILNSAKFAALCLHAPPGDTVSAAHTPSPPPPMPSIFSPHFSLYTPRDVLAPLRRHPPALASNTQPRLPPPPHFAATEADCTGGRSCFVPFATPGGSSFFYRIAGDSRTLVVFIATMESGADELAAVSGALWQAKYYGLDRLIIDLTQNGGGSICYGKRLMQMLLPDGPTHSWGPSDMPLNELSATMATNAASMHIDGEWSPGTYARDADNTAFVDASWMLNGVTRDRGAGPHKFSQLIHFSDAVCDADIPPPNATYSFSEIILVTNGLCGSTCAYFANHAVLYDHIKTVVVGGIHGRQQQYSSFPGLNVIDSAYAIESINNYIPTTDPQANLRVDPLPNSAHYSMTIREIYPFADSTIPTEYTYQPGAVRLDHTYDTMLYPELLWLTVNKMFTQ